jgi:hypothetical protein
MGESLRVIEEMIEQNDKEEELIKEKKARLTREKEEMIKEKEEMIKEKTEEENLIQKKKENLMGLKKKWLKRSAQEQMVTSEWEQSR